MLPLVLASGSPRRSQLLEQAGLRFEVLCSSADESIAQPLPPEELVQQLALRKAQAVLPLRPHALVLGADTVVELDGEILGKPANEAQAAEMLHRLSGREHRVYTGVALCSAKHTESFACCTYVRFFPFSEAEIAAYIATGEPMDKAGSYGIQGKGALLVESISGDYYNIMGLPLARVCKRLASLQEIFS